MPSTAELLRLFLDSQAALEALCAPLEVEDYVVQPMEDASPVKWHLAHVAWFFETFVLGPCTAGYQPFDPRFRFVFNSYYEAVGDRHPRPERGLLSRPTLAEVRRYRRHVEDGMRRLLGEGARPLPPQAAFAVELGVNHSEQHEELIATDVKVVLAKNPLHPAYAPAPAPPALPARPGELGWVPHGGGLVEVGHAGDAFAFDNERPRHRVYLEPFQLSNRLVTCGEYLEFVQDGGYRAPTLWLSDGWATCQARGWEAPMYWERAEGGGFQVATLHGLRPVDPLEPVVHVSFYEAEAFARWRGVRLPLEAEWEVAVAASAPEPAPARTAVHPAPLRAPPAPGQVAQAFGTAWQWTQSPYVAYPGFRPFEGGFGEYNGKFMANQLVLRGSSCATPPRHARRTYRNFFHPDARWQLSGIRLAR